MHGFRRCSSGILVVAAICFFISSITAFAETAGSSSSASSDGGVESNSDSTGKPLIQAQIQELEGLLASMDAVHINLTKVAEKALKDSDSAPTLTERRHYEQLYAETNARLGELQATRAEINRLLGELETRLEALKNAR